MIGQDLKAYQNESAAETRNVHHVSNKLFDGYLTARCGATRAALFQSVRLCDGRVSEVRDNSHCSRLHFLLAPTYGIIPFFAVSNMLPCLVVRQN